MAKRKGPEDPEVVAGLAYGSALMLGSMFVGMRLMEEETDGVRRERMAAALKRQIEEYDALYQEEAIGPSPDLDGDGELTGDELLTSLGSGWDPEMAAKFVIDLLFTRPFSPSFLNFEVEDQDDALCEIAFQIGVPTFMSGVGAELLVAPEDDDDLDPLLADAFVGSLRLLEKSARKAHRKINWKTIGLWGGAGLAIGLVTAGMAAPFIAAAIGGAAGLAGAAALAHGLAVLGFGSLAAGGLGMAGGLWIVAGSGALVAGTTVSAGAFLAQMGSIQAREEIVKLQVATAAVTIPTSVREASTSVGVLAERRQEINQLIDDALTRNEDDAPEIEDLEAIVESLSSAMEWINEQVEDAS